MNLRQAAQQALEALEIGHDSAQAEADQYHTAMAGYRPERHAQMDADVQQIANAITALRAALAEQDRLEGIEAIEKDAGIHVSQQAEPECKCTMRQKLVGDGCAVCNPERAKALAEPQTTHWEGCEAVHPECKTEHEVKDLSNYEFKTYNIGGFHLGEGFYSAAELREMVKEFDAMDAAAKRSMRKMK